MSAIGSGIGDEFPQSPPSATEKRKHAEIGDGSPQSPPPPMEKRDRVENMEQLMPPEVALFLESSQSPGDQECDGGGKDLRNVDKERERRQERMKKRMEKETAMFEKLGVKFPRDDDSDDSENEMDMQVGRMDGYFMKIVSDFKENHHYVEYTGFAKKVIAYCNDKNNKNFCFDDIKEVSLCTCCGNNCWLTIIVRDTVDANFIMILQSEGKIRHEEADFEIGSCKLLTIDDLVPLRASDLAAH